MIPSLSVLYAQEAGFEVTVESADDLSGLTAVVGGSDEGLRLRSEPAHDAEVLETLPDGTVVSLRIDVVDTVMDEDGTTRWWPVTANGIDGWVSGFYLEASDGAASAGSDGTDASTPAAETPDVTSSSTEAATGETEATGEGYTFTGDSLSGATAHVDGDGGSVNLRSEPSASSDLVTTLSDGAIVTLRIDTTDTVTEGGVRWWPVAIDGFEGWVSGQYLTDASAAPASDVAADGTTEATAGAFVAGSYAETFTGDGDGVNLRAEAAPDAPLLEIVPEGTVLQVLEGPLSFEASEAGWFRVTTGSTTGYVDGDLLVAATDAETSSSIPTTDALVAGDFALVVTETGAGGRIRSSASPEGERIGFVPERERVEILSGPASHESSERGWYEVSYNGVTGYIDGDLLVRTEAPTPEPTVAPTATATAPTLPDANANLVAGEVVITQSDTGVGVNVRTQPGTGADRTGYLADGSSLEVLEGPSQDPDGANWYKVTNGLVEGWVYGAYLQRTNAETPDSGTEQTAAFIAPLDEYIVTQEMGCSNLGYYVYDAAWGCAVHDGIDLATSAGTPLKASAAGTVVFAGWTDGGLGYYVEIDHGNGIHTLYGHMQDMPSVAVGDSVQQGQEIGPLGSTGLSTGPHVHFMVRVNGESVNPRDYVTFEN
jgi:murein DD-endopeptidase MepM/ murein hydrolase activator NlpD